MKSRDAKSKTRCILIYVSFCTVAESVDLFSIVILHISMNEDVKGNKVSYCFEKNTDILYE